nr:gustatory receptor [Semanotus bifasciatus]
MLENQTKRKTKYVVYKEAFLYHEKNDIRTLRCIYTFGRYCAVTPLSFDGNEYLKKCIATCLVVVFSFCIGYSIKEQVINTDMSSVAFTINVLWRVSILCFMLICVTKSNMFKSTPWETLLKRLEELDASLRKFDFQMIRNIYRFQCEIAVFFFISIGPNIYHTYELYSHDERVFLGVVWGVLDFFMGVVFIIIYNFLQILRRRLIFLNEMVGKLGKIKILDNAVVYKLNEVISLYRLVYTLIDNFNEILGWHVFFYISTSVLYALFAIEFALISDERRGFTVLMTYVIIYATSILFLVILCDSIEKCGNDLVEECYLLHRAEKSLVVKEKLMHLATFVEKCKVPISAAGFYSINQLTLTALFESIIMYLVIIIQFNLALDSSSR